MVAPVDDTAPANLPMRGGTLVVAFENKEDLQKQKAEYLCNDSLFVSTQSHAQPFCEFSLIMNLPNGTQCEPVPARLVQLAHGMGMFLQFISMPPSVQQAIDKCLAQPSPIMKEPHPPSIEEPEPKAGQSQDRMTLHQKLRAMNPNERSRLASHANKLTRSLLIRDIEPQVIMFLLKNPRITRGEVIEISKSPRIGYQAVKIILSNKNWSQSEEIRYNLVQNPKTPLPDALKMIPGLNMKHLRELAKNHGVKTRIKQSALRLVLERGSM